MEVDIISNVTFDHDEKYERKRTGFEETDRIRALGHWPCKDQKCERERNVTIAIRVN